MVATASSRESPAATAADRRSLASLPRAAMRTAFWKSVLFPLAFRGCLDLLLGSLRDLALRLRQESEIGGHGFFHLVEDGD